jgi:CheY-like chemotaxis protein
MERQSAVVEMGRGLHQSLGPVLGRRASILDVSAARDVAGLLLLSGLERVLVVLLPHAGGDWPAAFGPVIDRMRRLREGVAPERALAEFQKADGELAGYAAQLEHFEWRPMPGKPRWTPSVPTLSVADALADLPVADRESLAQARDVHLAAPIAAALRATLDWTAGADGPTRPVRISFDASCVEIRFDVTDMTGLMPAHEVLAPYEGSLGPAFTHDPRSAPEPWILRVPPVVEKRSYLMFEQGGQPFAIPWHAVLKVGLDDVDAAPLPRLRRLAGGGPIGGGRPFVIAAWGLKRAILDADRLVWRLQAMPESSPGPPPVPGVTGAVRTEDDGVYWIVDLESLMQSVPLPPVPDAPRRVRVEPVPEPARTKAEAPSTQPSVAPPRPARPASPHVLSRAEVEPLQKAGAVVVPPARPVPATPAAMTPPARPAASAPAPAAVAPSVAPPPVRHVAPPAPATVAPPPRPVAAPSVAPPERPGRDTVPAAAGPVQGSAAPVPPAPSPTAVSGEPAQPSGAEAPPTRPTRGLRGHTALVAEDSLTARMFLSRHLQMQGFEVRAVDCAADLRRELASRAWALVCVDIELPDARGTKLVREVVGSQTLSVAPAAVVVLVRDRADMRMAAEAGVQRTLRKPYDAREVVELLDRIGFVPARPA